MVGLVFDYLCVLVTGIFTKPYHLSCMFVGYQIYLPRGGGCGCGWGIYVN